MKRILLYSLLSMGITIGSIFFGGYTYYKSIELPEIEPLNESSKIYDSEEILLDEIHGEEHREIVKLSDISPDLIRSILAIEDKKFYEHKGINIEGVIRAALINIQEGNRKEGASTITMQLAKNLFSSINDRTWENKIRESILALKLEKKYSKEYILEMYLNTIYWGNNTYGAKTAAETYFNKDVKDLAIHEASLLAAMIQNPSRYNVYKKDNNKSYQQLKNRQKKVLELIVPKCLEEDCSSKWIENEWNKPLLFTGKTTWKSSKEGYITDLAIQEAIKLIPNITSIKDLKIGGYKIYSTISKKQQDIVKDIFNKYKKGKDGAEIALVGIDPKTNKVIVSVGGLDYNKSKLNRTTDIGGLKGRQSGSSIKPYVYYTALKLGWKPNDKIVDEAICINMRWERPYCPKNYGSTYSGLDTLTNHLAKSRNIPAVKLGLYVGNKTVIKTMKELGITTRLSNVPSFPLGSNNLIPIEHANALAAFANGGYYQPYTSIKRIEDKYGNTIYEYENKQVSTLDFRAVGHLNEMLSYTAKYGTATRANTIRHLDIKAKTGTTDNNKDVWCMAYTDNISLAVWIGHDDFNKRLRNATGGSWACPIVGAYFKAIYK